MSGVFFAIMTVFVIRWFSVGTKAEAANICILGGYFTEATEKSGNISEPCAWLLSGGRGWWLPPAARETDETSPFDFLFFLTLDSF